MGVMGMGQMMNMGANLMNSYGTPQPQQPQQPAYQAQSPAGFQPAAQPARGRSVYPHGSSAVLGAAARRKAGLSGKYFCPHKQADEAGLSAIQGNIQL